MLQVQELLSWDSVDPNEADTVYSAIPQGVLNKICLSGLPPHRLLLKVGAPILLIRNLHKETGLMNGTHLIVRAFTSRVIEARIVTGSHVGNIALLPRLNITSKDETKPFALRRREFPVKGVSMSINKSQGQTFEQVGIYLPTDCFSHGQLYVAMSRVGTEEGVRVCTEDEEMPSNQIVTRDPLWPEMLL